jgi:AraC-like DNA-binding protein
MERRDIPLTWALERGIGAVAQGIPMETLFRESLIVPRFGDDRDRVSFPQLGLMFLNMVVGTDDEACGLGRKRIPLGHSALSIRVMLGCETLERAISALVRLHDRSMPLQVALVANREDAQLIVQCRNDFADDHAPLIEEMFMNTLFMAVSHFIGRPLPVKAMQTRNAKHVSLGSRHYSMFAPVTFSPVSALRFPRQLLSLKRVGEGSDEIFWTTVRQWFAFIDEALINYRAATPKITDLKVEVVARRHRVSSATLRRRASRSDGGFRHARSRLIIAASADLLRDPSNTVDAIAADFGYADARSFRRFFKHATGKTPSEFRSQAMLEPTSGVRVRERIEALAVRLSQ